ncbi:helix-turn-helix domain-containing protein [Amylibacter sp. SFDW26]|nr:helix-turn-helix domain-containing protein [Amylibacter sp. SFDW26]
MACLTSMIEPLRAANEIVGKDVFSWQLVGETHSRVTSSAAVGFDPDIDLDGVDGLDYLYVLSAPQSEFKDAKHSNGVLRRLVQHGMYIGGISGGVFPLARAGLLDGFTTSVHWCYRAAFEAEFPQLETVDDVIYSDRSRTTVSGAAAGFDVMLNLIKQEHDSEVMTEVACWFQHPLVRGAGVQQRIPTANSSSTDDMLPPAIQKAVQLFSESLDEPISVTEVADIVGLSPRQMERKFKQETGQSPIHFYRSKRMNAARQLVQYSGVSMAQIALAVGYSTSALLVKYYTEEFGVTPQEDREKVNMFRVKKNAPVPSV